MPVKAVPVDPEDPGTPTSTFDRLLSRSTRTAKLTFPARPEDGARLAKTAEDLDQAKQLHTLYPDDESYRLRQEDAQEAYDKVRADAVTFTVEMAGIGPSKVREIIGEHPPTKAQKAEGRAKTNGSPAGEPEFNIDTFAPVLLSAVVQRIVFSDDPQGALEGLTEGQARQLWDESKWSDGDRLTVFNTAIGLDAETSLVEDLGKG